jgi:hypothetical protein
MHIVHPQKLGVALAYLVGIICLSLATALLGRAAGLPPLLAVMGAQIVAVFGFSPAWDYYREKLCLSLSHLYSISGTYATPSALATLFVALFFFLGTGSRARSRVLLLLLPAIALYSVCCNPLFTTVMFVFAPVLCCGILIGSPTRNSLRWRLAGAGFCLATALCLGISALYRSFNGYMARRVFPNELYSEIQQFDYLNAFVFQGPYAALAVGLLVASCIAVIWLGSRQEKGFACSVLVSLVLMTVMGLVYVYSGIRWSLPSPSYLEHGLFPAYVVVLLLGAYLAWQRVRTKTKDYFSGKLTSSERSVQSVAAAYALILVIPLGALAYGYRVRGWGVWLRQWLQVSEELREDGPILGCLKKELAIPPSGEFRGSVATVVCVPGGPLASRLGFADDAPWTKKNIGTVPGALLSFHPQLFITDLWELGIPTLEEYNQLITPPFYFVFSRALSRPKDYQSRNWAFVTLPRPRLMAALGVRFIMTDVRMHDLVLFFRTSQTNADGVTLFLYELVRPNLGDYSPTKVRVVKDAREAIDRMVSDGMRFEEEVLLFDELPSPTLVQAESAWIAFERGGVRIRAKSRGTSLLVLPLQFSNSLEVVPTQSGAGAERVKLVRTNLLQAGIFFSGDIDVKIAHVFGPFRGTAGRRRDIEDCKRLGVEETGEVLYPPDYQPLRIRFGDR